MCHLGKTRKLWLHCLQVSSLSQHRHLSLQVQLAPPAQLQALLVVSNDVAVVLVEVEVHRPATTAAGSLDSSDY